MGEGIRIGTSHDLGVDPTQVCAFYSANWPRPIALSLPRFYRWQFMDAPAAEGFDNCCVAVDGKCNVVGVMGLHPHPFRLNGEVRNAAALTTWVVAQQGAGLGVRMLNFLKDRYEILLGTGITAAALPLYMAAGFRYMASIPRFIKIIDWEAVQPYAHHDKLGSRLVRNWSPKNVRVVPALEVTDWSEAQDVADSISRGTNQYLRDAAHLRWRFSSHPTFSYKTFIVGEGADRGLVVLRVDRLEQFTIAHVMECLGSQTAMKANLDFISHFCLENDVHVADFFCTCSQVNAWFLANEWFSVLDDRGFRFPHLFYPVELREPPTTSLIMWAKDNFADFLDLGRMYLTKADLDLDRPTLAYYKSHGIVEE